MATKTGNYRRGRPKSSARSKRSRPRATTCAARIAAELADGTDHLQQGQHPTAQAPRHLSAGRPRASGRAASRSQAAKAKFYSFMVRTKIPGGKLTSDQLLAELDLCDEVGNTTLRITTRQGLQLHGVLKTNLQRDDSPHQRSAALDAGRLRRREAQRDVLPCPYKGDPVHDQMQDLADELAVASHAAHRAYHEFWLTDRDTGEAGAAPAAVERADGHDRSSRSTGRPICRGNSRPPSACPATTASTSTPTTSACWPSAKTGTIVGYNVLVGGGFGVTPSAKKTFPGRGASRWASSTPEQVVDVCDGDHQSAARFRQPRRPQSGPHEVPDPRLGPGRGSSQRSRSITATRCAAAPGRRPRLRRSAWAGTSRATAAGSTA